MKKNIDLVIDGIAPEKVMYDTDNHSLVVLYPAQEEFKKGDIVFDNDRIIIVKNMTSDFYVLYYQPMNNISFNSLYGIPFSASTVRLATPEEKQTLFDALKKEGKKWNAETLQVEDLDISDIVVDGASACEYLNKSIPKNYIYDAETKFEKQINAQITLQLIREAWNKFDGFKPNLKDESQPKYNPYKYVSNSYLEAVSISEWIGFESVLVFKTKKRALQFGTQFKELFKTAMGL